MYQNLSVMITVMIKDLIEAQFTKDDRQSI